VVNAVTKAKCVALDIFLQVRPRQIIEGGFKDSGILVYRFYHPCLNLFKVPGSKEDEI
jgi:hypothetical protein